jgi:hypothetical protein
LSRHRKIQWNRSKALALVAVGAFSVASAASAAATTWPQGPSTPPASSAHDAGHRTRVTVTDQLTPAQVPQASQALRAYHISSAAELAAGLRKAARERAARAAKGAAAARAAAAAARPAARSSAPPPSQGAAPAASGSPQQIAEAMLSSFGWSSGQFSCLDPLWAHESGWSVTASNAGSGAYGIPQALPGSRMASAGPDWQSDAATQIRWGLEYIRNTYGSPCGAWDHELATGWY